MNFDFSDEQRLLKDSLERLLARNYSPETRKTWAAGKDGFSREMWAAYAELGLLALPFAEDDGGLGGSAEDVMLVAQSFGKVLALEPFLATCVLCGGLLKAGASAQQRAELVPQIAAGEKLLAFAHMERDAGYCLSHVATTAKHSGKGWTLDGAKSLVLSGDSADSFIVSARISGNTRDEAGIGLFLVDARAKGVSVRGYPTQDGLRAAEVTLAGVHVDDGALLGGSKNAYGAIALAVDETVAALCAEAVGAMDEMLATTVEYIKTRKQFGRPIGDFQVLQHRAAEMVVESEQARSMAFYATMMARAADATERAKALSAAKAQIGRSGRVIGQSAIQLHGGVGMTMEFAVGHYFKRVTMIDKLFGDVDFHVERLGLLGGLRS